MRKHVKERLAFRAGEQDPFVHQIQKPDLITAN